MKTHSQLFRLIHATLGLTTLMSSYLHGSGHFLFSYKLHQGCCQSSLLQCQHSYLYTVFTISCLTAILTPCVTAACRSLPPVIAQSPGLPPGAARALPRSHARYQSPRRASQLTTDTVFLSGP